MAVNHSHIVPAGYLRQFALADEQITIVLTKIGREIRTTVKNAAVRGGGHYKRERPDGSRSDDVETVSLRAIENDAVPILRELPDRWPLSGEDKLILAQFIGMQLVRGPRWFAWHDEFTVENIGEYRASGAFQPRTDDAGVSEEEIFQANLDFFRGSTQTLMAMLRLGAKVGCAVGSMCWTLVEFARPVLATSDHPVVVWPMTDGGRHVQATVPAEVGVRNFLEVRLPVSPERALLMTWRDLPDDPSPVPGKPHHAHNLNAFTIAEAEEQWFFLPGAKRPRIRSGTWLPLSASWCPATRLLLRSPRSCVRRSSATSRPQAATAPSRSRSTTCRRAVGPPSRGAPSRELRVAAADPVPLVARRRSAASAGSPAPRARELGAASRTLR